LNRYDESVYAARWLLLVVVLAMAASIGGAVLVLASEESAWWVSLQLVAVASLLGAIQLTFRRLRIEVTSGRLCFRFGPFGPTLKLSEVRSAQPSTYRWAAFGGWGIRFRRFSGLSVRAYSVPFLRTGVAVETAEDGHYYISSRRPEALAGAILGGHTWEGPA